jgi:hypothetical protein
VAAVARADVRKDAVQAAHEVRELARLARSHPLLAREAWAIVLALAAQTDEARLAAAVRDAVVPRMLFVAPPPSPRWEDALAMLLGVDQHAALHYFRVHGPPDYRI